MSVTAFEKKGVNQEMGFVESRRKSEMNWDCRMRYDMPAMTRVLRVDQ